MQLDDLNGEEHFDLDEQHETFFEWQPKDSAGQRLSSIPAASVETVVTSERQNRKQIRDEFRSWSLLRFWVWMLVESPIFNGFILLIIFSNVAAIILQINKVLIFQYGWYFSALDNVFLGIYLAELLMRIFVWRLRFFRDGWNLFDLVVVGFSLLEVIALLFLGQMSFVNPKILRLLRLIRTMKGIRALRVLRTITFLNSLQVIAATLLRSLPAMGSIFALVTLVIYVFAIIGVNLYKDTLPERFGSIFQASMTMFQLMTLDDWYFIYNDGRYNSPFLFLYLTTAIIIGTFILVNLLTAVIVNNLEHSNDVLAKERQMAQNQTRKRLELEQAKNRLNQIKPSNITASAPSSSNIHMKNPNNRPESLRRQKLISMAILLQGALESQVSQYQTLEKVHDDLRSSLHKFVEEPQTNSL